MARTPCRPRVLWRRASESADPAPPLAALGHDARTRRPRAHASAPPQSRAPSTLCPCFPHVIWGPMPAAFPRRAPSVPPAQSKLPMLGSGPVEAESWLPPALTPALHCAAPLSCSPGPPTDSLLCVLRRSMSICAATGAAPVAGAAQQARHALATSRPPRSRPRHGHPRHRRPRRSRPRHRRPRHRRPRCSRPRHSQPAPQPALAVHILPMPMPMPMPMQPLPPPSSLQWCFQLGLHCVGALRVLFAV